jgi:hypothetical protein
MAKKKPVKKTKKKAVLKGLKKITRNKHPKTRARPQPLRAPPQQTLIPDRDEPESVTMIELEFTRVKKLTSKIIVGKKLAKLEEKTRLYSIIGIASGLKSGESNYGAWTALTGRFEVVRFADGERLSAPFALLPDEAALPVIAAVRDAAGAGIEFGFVVCAEPTLGGKGYSYDIEVIVPPRKNDALADLRKRMDDVPLDMFHVEQ